MTNKTRLGELLIQQNLVSQDIIDQALHAQVGGNRRLGHILVRMKAITDDQLAETLASQLDISICDISSKFSPEVRRVVPRYLCRKYGILPLALKSNNVLEVAMANPSDDEAINDIEHYTDMAIEPCLARHSDIDREIQNRIPLGVKDVFSPRSNTWFTRIGLATCLTLVALVGGFSYQYMYNTTYGTTTVSQQTTMYKNHDLILGFDASGKINLLGRGAFAQGYYSVSFKNPLILQAFIKSRDTDLSNNQKDWLDWVIAREQTKISAKSIAINE